MKRELIPSWEELEAHKKTVPEINPAAVIAMLEIKQASDEVQASILDVLQKEYHLSAGAGTGFHERDLAAALPARHEAHGTPE